MLLSIVMPVFNEAEALPLLLPALRHALAQADCDYELLFVDDGSTDSTAIRLQSEALADARIKVLHLSRNFGHQTAITAGLDFAEGDAVIVMDADLQDPPDLIPVLLSRYRSGYDVVSAVRVDRSRDTAFKRITARWFYGLMRRLVDPRLKEEVGDFRLFSRRAVLALRRFREQHRFMRGLVAWLGLREAVVPYQRPERAAGTTKYTFAKMARFAWTAVSSFSALPLRVSLAFGVLLTLAGGGFLAWVLFARYVAGATVPGWSSLVALQVVSSGVLLLSLGIVGDYVGRLYEEIKQRPLYVLGARTNFTDRSAAPPRALVLSGGLEQDKEIHVDPVPAWPSRVRSAG